MSCSNEIPKLDPIKCGDMPMMRLEDRRLLHERQSWIYNVMRIQGLTYEEAEKLWLKIQLDK